MSMGLGCFMIFFQTLWKIFDFLVFLKNFPSKSELLVSTDRKFCGNSPCINATPKFFTQKVMTLRKVKFSISSPFVQNF